MTLVEIIICREVKRRKPPNLPGSAHITWVVFYYRPTVTALFGVLAFRITVRISRIRVTVIMKEK